MILSAINGSFRDLTRILKKPYEPASNSSNQIYKLIGSKEQAQKELGFLVSPAKGFQPWTNPSILLLYQLTVYLIVEKDPGKTTLRPRYIASITLT